MAGPGEVNGTPAPRIQPPSPPPVVASPSPPVVSPPSARGPITNRAAQAAPSTPPDLNSYDLVEPLMRAPGYTNLTVPERRALLGFFIHEKGYISSRALQSLKKILDDPNRREDPAQFRLFLVASPRDMENGAAWDEYAKIAEGSELLPVIPPNIQRIKPRPHTITGPVEVQDFFIRGLVFDALVYTVKVEDQEIKVYVAKNISKDLKVPTIQDIAKGLAMLSPEDFAVIKLVNVPPENQIRDADDPKLDPTMAMGRSDGVMTVFGRRIPRSLDFFFAVVSHEVGHRFDGVKGIATIRDGDVDEYGQAVARDGRILTDYGRIISTEDFAELRMYKTFAGKRNPFLQYEMNLLYPNRQEVVEKLLRTDRVMTSVQYEEVYHSEEEYRLYAEFVKSGKEQTLEAFNIFIREKNPEIKRLDNFKFYSLVSLYKYYNKIKQSAELEKNLEKLGLGPKDREGIKKYW